MGKALVLNNVNFSENALDQVSIIMDIPCESLTLSDSPVTFEFFGDTFTITATPVPSNTTDAIIWNSSNNEIVSVSDGILTLHGLGNATITAICGDCSASVEVSVSSAKVKNIYPLSGAYVNKRNDNEPCMVMGSNASFQTVGQHYDQDDTSVHVLGGAERDIQAILVPYGAVKIGIITTDDSIPYVKVTTGDTLDRVDVDGTSYPKWLNMTASINATMLPDVVPTQCLMVRYANTETFAKFSGIYFSTGD